MYLVITLVKGMEMTAEFQDKNSAMYFASLATDLAVEYGGDAADVTVYCVPQDSPDDSVFNAFADL